MKDEKRKNNNVTKVLVGELKKKATNKKSYTQTYTLVQLSLW